MGNIEHEEKKEIKHIKLKDILGNIKSKYILQKIFNNLEKKKSLYLIKYNKNIKNQMEININDYKEFSEIYTPIEIDIKLSYNKTESFICHSNYDENGKYYHIYFNNNKEEIKRSCVIRDEKVKIVKLIIDYQVKSFKELFCRCKAITSINFKKFYRKNITDMNSMFSKCSSLKKLNLSNFNTDNVTDMANMFSECESLK